MSIRGALLDMIERVAVALGPDLRQRMVFVGGCTTALLITDMVTLEDVRTTDDVDLITDIAGGGAWLQLQEQLFGKGFSVSPDDDVVCRMRLGALKVDFMPDDEAILGFTNRWYAMGIETAVRHALTNDIEIKHLTPPLFVATKLEAYLGRGQNDLLHSHDMEDILLVVDGRPQLFEEIRRAPGDVRSFVAKQFVALSRDASFEHFVEGNIRGPQGRADLVRERFLQIAQV